ncbi:hypothetical protein [Vibrio sp. WXL103]|uniref:hypothetical protein n=1 Tax=Vibrio sp. WXL103 TaxID=3450710 RepID=UPI003EC776AF
MILLKDMPDMPIYTYATNLSDESCSIQENVMFKLFKCGFLMMIIAYLIGCAHLFVQRDPIVNAIDDGDMAMLATIVEADPTSLTTFYDFPRDELSPTDEFTYGDVMWSHTRNIIYSEDYLQVSPLGTAVFYRKTEIVKWLLQKGADPALGLRFLAPDSRTRTYGAYSLLEPSLAFKQDREIGDLLKQYGGDPNNAVWVGLDCTPGEKYSDLRVNKTNRKLVYHDYFSLLPASMCNGYKITNDPAEDPDNRHLRHKLTIDALEQWEAWGYDYSNDSSVYYGYTTAHVLSSINTIPFDPFTGDNSELLDRVSQLTKEGFIKWDTPTHRGITPVEHRIRQLRNANEVFTMNPNNYAYSRGKGRDTLWYNTHALNSILSATETYDSYVQAGSSQNTALASNKAQAEREKKSSGDADSMIKLGILAATAGFAFDAGLDAEAVSEVVEATATDLYLNDGQPKALNNLQTQTQSTSSMTGGSSATQGSGDDEAMLKQAKAECGINNYRNSGYPDGDQGEFFCKQAFVYQCFANIGHRVEQNNKAQRETCRRLSGLEGGSTICNYCP